MALALSDQGEVGSDRDHLRLQRWDVRPPCETFGAFSILVDSCTRGKWDNNGSPFKNYHADKPGVYWIDQVSLLVPPMCFAAGELQYRRMEALCLLMSGFLPHYDMLLTSLFQFRCSLVVCHFPSQAFHFFRIFFFSSVTSSRLSPESLSVSVALSHLYSLDWEPHNDAAEPNVKVTLN